MTLDTLLSLTNSPAKDNWQISYGEFVKFFWKYKGLLKHIERDNNFWESTNENLKIAYEQLDRKDIELEYSNGLNKKYLDNIKEGLVLIEQDFTILDQYSLFMLELFKTDQIKNKNIVDLIYPDINQFANERKELEKYLTILFSNTLTDIDMIMDINPLHNKTLFIKDKNNNTHEIIIDASFIRIYNNSNVENVMIIFEDKTNIVKMQKKLEREKGRYQTEVESISAILKAGPRTFIDFINEAKEVIKLFENNISNLDNMNIVDKIFRQIHSLKGAAKHLELIHLANIANKIEDILSIIKKEKHQVNINDIKYYITNLNEEFSDVEKLYKRFQNFSQYTSKTFQNNTDKYDSFLDSLKGMVTNLSKEMGKETKIIINNNIKNFPFYEFLKNPLIQIIRNAIDHAIEDPYERLSKLKKQYGVINIRSYENENEYIIDIQDDGRGIDFEKIKLKAIQMNLLNETLSINNIKLLQLIFNPNFTSKDHVSSLSGRGYGLDVVKDAMASLGGKITVNTLKDKGTKFSLIIPKKRIIKK